MFWLVLSAVIIVLLFHKEITRRPRNSLALLGGCFAAWVIFKVIQADPGYQVIPMRTWIVGIVLALAVVSGTELFRTILDRVWPKD
jgi:hypothetical protein